MTTKYHVCWGPDAVAFVEVPDGSAFKTGQPNDEVFDARDDAARRAFELNYTGFDHFKLEDDYEEGQYVIFRYNLYRALDKVEPYFVDPDRPGPVQEPPFPNRDQTRWVLVTVPDESDPDSAGAVAAPRKRARHPDGTYKANDSTTQANEAWVES